MMSRRPQKGPRQPKTARKPFCGRFFRLLAAEGGKGQGKFENKKKILTEVKKNIAIPGKWVYNMITCRAV